MLLDYRDLVGNSERSATHQVNIRYISSTEFYQVELIVRSPDAVWTDIHQDLMRQMVYDLREELLKITLSRHW